MISLNNRLEDELKSRFDVLSSTLEGELEYDYLTNVLYAQDASVYTLRPKAVAFPKTTDDVSKILAFANQHEIPLVPRGAGTSLAGQTICEGIVLDIGRYMNKILEVNAAEKWVRVQPGVVLDELNRALEPTGLWFGPDTSTASRCMIGGMIGNNSCGTHSILYGNTMQHVFDMEIVLDDGSVFDIKPWNTEALNELLQTQSRLSEIVRFLIEITTQNSELIREKFPDASVIRRNTGYPLDEIANQISSSERDFSLGRFLCGTEGTLVITTEVKLNLVPRPKARGVVCVHFDDIMDALRATVIAVEHGPSAVELIDRRILEQTKSNIEQSRNRSFVEGDPDAILVVEFYGATEAEIDSSLEKLVSVFTKNGLGFAHPIIKAPEDKKVWALRKAGLGLLMGIPGDKKAVSVVEDTAVPVVDLPEYVAEVMEIMKREKTQSVYHAHASVGELHIRPELDLKDPDDIDKFIRIAEDVADLVAKYRGSLSGEHGDGKVRSPLIERVMGEEVVELFRRTKTVFDPKGILNPNNIVNPNPMTEDFRYPVGLETPEVETFFDWSADQGFFRAVEKCNGAGLCRRKSEAGGTMCPSYMATLDEKDSTRGRANVLRNLLLSEGELALESRIVYESLDLCVSCKGCKSECPANVDMGRMKAEFLQKYHDRNGLPRSAWFFGNYVKNAGLASFLPGLSNWGSNLGLTKYVMKKFAGVSDKRILPKVQRGLTKTFAPFEGEKESVWLYVDPFINFTEPKIGSAVIEVLRELGFGVELLPINDDGRSFLSKGLVRKAKAIMNENVETLTPLLQEYPDRKIVGIEPSALLTFCDEQVDLVSSENKSSARDIASRSLLFDDFIASRLEDLAYAFQGDREPLVLHGHCHQKALVGTTGTEKALVFFGYEIETLATGCCGMAGSFGYEEEHYEVSMKIGELVLFPALRKTKKRVVAPGTSCRHQIKDGVSKIALHPAQLILEALHKN